MANNKTNNEQVKKIAICIGAGALALFIVLYCFASILFRTMDPRKWIIGNNQEQEQGEDEDEAYGNSGLVFPDEAEGNGLKVMAMSIPVALYEEYGVAAAAESALQLTVTPTSSDADLTGGTFTIAFKNPSSDWATDKDVSSYITLSQSDTKNATVSCLGAFGEQIIVTYSVEGVGGTKSATYTLDYAKSVISSLKISGNVLLSGVENASENIISASRNMLVLAPVFSDYTVDDTFTSTVNLKISDTFMSACSQSESFSNSFDSVDLSRQSFPIANALKAIFGSAYGTQQLKDDIAANNAKGIFEVHVVMTGTHSTYEADFYLSLDVSLLPILATDVQLQDSSGGTGHIFSGGEQ